MAQRIWTQEDLKQLGYDDEPQVHQITGAEERQSVDVDARFKSYSLKMAIRVICIVAAVFTHGWLQIACIAGAAVLPWIAVVAANGANRQPKADFSQYLPQEQAKMLIDAQKNEAQKNKAEKDEAQEDAKTGAQTSPTSEKLNTTDPLIFEGEVVREDED